MQSRNKPYIIQSIYNEPSSLPQIPEVIQDGADLSSDINRTKIDINNNTATLIDDALSTLTQYKASQAMSAGALVNLGLDADGNDACFPATSTSPAPLTILSNSTTGGLEVYRDSTMCIMITFSQYWNGSKYLCRIIPVKITSDYTKTTGSTQDLDIYGGTDIRAESSVKIDNGHFCISHACPVNVSGTNKTKSFYTIFGIDSSTLTITALKNFNIEHGTYKNRIFGSITYNPTNKKIKSCYSDCIVSNSSTNESPILYFNAITVATDYTMTSAGSSSSTETYASYNGMYSGMADKYHDSPDPDYDSYFGYCSYSSNYPSSNYIHKYIYYVSDSGANSKYTSPVEFKQNIYYDAYISLSATSSYIFYKSMYAYPDQRDVIAGLINRSAMTSLYGVTSASCRSNSMDYVQFVFSLLSPGFFVIIYPKDMGTGNLGDSTQDFVQITGATTSLVSTSTVSGLTTRSILFNNLKYLIRGGIYWYNPAQLRDAGFIQDDVVSGALVYVQLLQKDIIDKGDPNCVPGTLYKSNNVAGTIIARGFKKGRRIITANFYDLY